MLIESFYKCSEIKMWSEKPGRLEEWELDFSSILGLGGSCVVDVWKFTNFGLQP